VSIVDILSIQNEYRIFKPVKATRIRGVRWKEEKERR
jgi:hypothetical protein